MAQVGKDGSLRWWPSQSACGRDLGISNGGLRGSRPGRCSTWANRRQQISNRAKSEPCHVHTQLPAGRRPSGFRRHGRQSPRPTILAAAPTAAGPHHRGRHHHHVYHVACGSGARSQSLVGTHPHPPPLYKGRRICGWVGTRRHEIVPVVAVPWYAAVPSGRSHSQHVTPYMLRLATSPVRRAFRNSGPPYHHRGWECGKSKWLLDNLSVIVVTNCDNMRRQRCHPRWW